MLILGAGWISTFLITLLLRETISDATATTTGPDGTLKLTSDPASDSLPHYAILPAAQTILITFHTDRPRCQRALAEAMYTATHPSATPQWIWLCSMGICSIPEQKLWVTRHAAYDKSNSRAFAEDERFGARRVRDEPLWSVGRHTAAEGLDRSGGEDELAAEGEDELACGAWVDVARGGRC